MAVGTQKTRFKTFMTSKERKGSENTKKYKNNEHIPAYSEPVSKNRISYL